jgi:hypothetical protein
MKKTKGANSQGDKPFLAARIPHSLESALESHVESTGESKTQTVINALGKYLKWSENLESPDASDRLSILERKVSELEKLLDANKQAENSDNSSVIKKDINFDNKVDSFKSPAEPIAVIKNHSNSDNNKNSKIEEVKHKDTSVLMTHRDIANLTGLNYNSVKSHPEGKVINHGNRSFHSTEESGRWKWKEVVDSLQQQLPSI